MSVFWPFETCKLRILEGGSSESEASGNELAYRWRLYMMP
jgi:hypothetical protein